MKLLIIGALLTSLLTFAKAEPYDCHSNITKGCTSNKGVNTVLCHSRYGGIKNVESAIQSYINLNLYKSYQYLLMSALYNTYQRNRPGFKKLYKEMSDRAFDDAIELIKHVTRRGGQLDFRAISQHTSSTAQQSNVSLGETELHSLGIALDIEKTLTDGAAHVHNASIHVRPYDPQTAHFIKEKFLQRQAASVRNMSGYVNDLSKIMYKHDPSLGSQRMRISSMQGQPICILKMYVDNIFGKSST